MREVVGSIPAVPLVFFAFLASPRSILRIPTGIRPNGHDGRPAYVHEQRAWSWWAWERVSPQRSGDARPTSDGGLASPQPSRNRHMLRDDGASGRRRTRLFSIVYSDDTDFFETSLPALASAGGEHGLVA